MSKQQMQIAVIVLGLMIIAGVLAKQFWRPAGPATPQAGPAVTPGIVLDQPPLPELVAKKQRMGLSMPWGRNPFVVKSKSSGRGGEDMPLSGMVVSGIVMQGDSGTAIVNGEIVREGDTFHGYKVVQIDKTGVRCEKDTESVVIPYAH